MKEVKQKILETARELFYTNGYSKVRMEDIAKRLGVSKKTLYKYYEGKHGILENVLEVFKEKVSTGVDAILN